MPRPKHAAHENHERWLVSYADFITLLFAFFVVMFASSQTDKGKAKQVSEAVEKALKEGSSVSSSVPPAVAKVLGGTVDDKGQGNAQMKGPGGAQKAAKEDRPEVMELGISLKLLSTQLADEIKEGKVEVSMTPRGIVVSLKQAAFFPSGTDAVDPATMHTIEKVAGALKAVENPLRIEGHTDSIPIHIPGSAVTGIFRPPAPSPSCSCCRAASRFPLSACRSPGMRIPSRWPITTRPRDGRATAAWIW